MAVTPQVNIPLPDGFMTLPDTQVAVRPGGADVRADPAADSAILTGLPKGEHVWARGAVFSQDGLWLQIPWQRGDQAGQYAWVAAGDTDFVRSAAYNQVAGAWMESGPVLDFRRSLARDMLRARGADEEKLARASTLRAEALAVFEDTLTRQTVPPGYAAFWQQQARLKLPAPFAHLPVHPLRLGDSEFAGFGPSLSAFQNADIFYSATRGMNPGLSYLVPEGTPLIAVADGTIIDTGAGQSVALRPVLAAGGLSNVVVIYHHLSSQIARAGETVKAGQIIGVSGWPVYTREDGTTGVQVHNAHVQLQIRLADNRHSDLLLNPLLFWTPRLVAFQARLAAHSGTPPYPLSGHLFGRLGFFSIGAFAAAPGPSVWEYRPAQGALWPPGVYDLDGLVHLLAGEG